MTTQIRSGEWLWDPSGDPGTLHRQGSVLVFANTGSDGQDYQSLLEGLLPGDVVHIDHVHDPDGWWAYTVTEAPTPGTSAPVVAAAHLTVDNYSGGFIRARAAPDTATTVDFALATTPGPGGAVYPNLAAIPDGAAVWADFAGNLGHLKGTSGADITGATLKGWITAGTVVNVHKDATDPEHPNLIVDSVVPPPPPADATNVKITSGGHGPTADPTVGDDMVVTFMLMTAPPTGPVAPVDLPTLRARLMVPTTLVSDEELTSYLDTCIIEQQEVCETDPRTEALDNALIRRVGRMVAARTLPLGAQDTEYGQAFIPRWDPILQELEAPYLRGGFA